MRLVWYTYDMEQTPVAAHEPTPNFEGNDSELLFKRIRDSHIKSQIVDLLLQKELDIAKKIEDGEYETIGENLYRLNGTVINRRDMDAFRAKSREEVEEALDKTITEAETSTNIAFGSEAPNVNEISLGWKLPNGQKPSTKQMAMVEAHEKGHVIRPYFGELFNRHFLQGFDTSKIVFTEQDYEQIKKENNLDAISFEQVRDNLVEAVFCAEELAERMSQLKNYYGLDGPQVFTKDQLQYAREHYVEDTGMDNYMRFFFQAITPETEEVFLRIMNSSGI